MQQSPYASPVYSAGHEQAGLEHYTAQQRSPSEPRHIFGLRATTFFLLCAIIVLVIAGAVGGGVGGTIAVKNAKTSCLASLNASSAAAVTACPTLSSSSSSSTSTTSSSTSSSSASSSPTSNPSPSSVTEIWGPVGTSIAYSGCPNNNLSTYETQSGLEKYTLYCGLDMVGNDILEIITPTFQLCMEACAAWNASPLVSKACKGVAFAPTFIQAGFPGSGVPVDCFLKSVADLDILSVPPNYLVDSAIVQ